MKKNFILNIMMLRKKNSSLRSYFLDVFFLVYDKDVAVAMLERCDVFIEKKHKLQINENQIEFIEFVPQDLFAETIEWLIKCYRETDDENYMEIVKRIRCICNMISDKPCKVQLIKTEKNEIRRILRRWPKVSKKESDPDWVAADILNRIKNQINGRKYYQKGKNTQAFEIVVYDKKAFLFDLERYVVYIFEAQQN